ncbi:MAG: hypothetical protein JWN17_789 [Frankiales bacterium]|nr:hypothetical protein [Frankiales bacterium]
MTLPLEPHAPAGFAAALGDLTVELGRPFRPGLELRTVPAPTRMAPHAVAVAADVEVDGEPVASGRFVVLHDPAGQDGWQGSTRVVAFVSSEVETEMATDPALGRVGWSWLTEALEQHGAAHLAAGGTVTRTVSTRFGQIAEPEDASEVEVRASWTAVEDEDGRPDLVAHLHAWCDLLCATAGLPPAGITALRPR